LSTAFEQVVNKKRLAVRSLIGKNFCHLIALLVNGTKS
jgi:hypothetical protein